MAGYVYGSSIPDEILALRRRIHELEATNELLRRKVERLTPERYTVPADQALRIANYIAWRHMHPDPNPTGLYGGREGLALATAEADLWDKRYKARKRREKQARRAA